MATEEEVLVRLGFSADAFESGATKAEAKMGEFSEHVKHHLEGPRMAMRALHTGIHQVIGISPLLGEAIFAAMGPATAAIGLLTIGFVHLAEKIKEITKDSKELAKSFEEFIQSAAKPIDSEKSLAEASAKTAKAFTEDRRRMAKEQNELNDPVESMMHDLKRQEEQFDATKDAAGKLAAQQEVLKRINVEMRQTGLGVEAYQSPFASAERGRVEFLKAKGEARIAELEKQAESERKIQEKFKDAAEEQRKVDEGEGLFPNINKVMDVGDTIRHEQATRYNAAIEAEKAYRRAIEETKGSVAKYDEQLKSAAATHEEQFSKLKELKSHHESLTEAVHRTEMEIEKEKESEAKRAEREEKQQHEKELRQKEFEQHRARLEQEEKRSEIEPFLPTIQQLARTPSWLGGDTWRFSMPQGPLIPTLDAERAGEQARELQAREADLRQTILVEGPQSSRAKEDLARVNELKRGLEEAGFIKTDHAEKMSERLNDLVEMAAGRGLNIKPVMAE